MKRAAALLAFAITACGAERPRPAPQADCEAVIFEDAALTHCTADPAKHHIRTALDGRDGNPARSFAMLAENLPAPAEVAFAMNAGMFDEDGNPIGYYVENGERRHTLNRNDGAGNFHLKPNGVFYGTGGTWQIRTTEDFAAKVNDRPEFATQSGPMLVIDGKLHPGFDANGQSRKIRNGVGVDTQGRAHFVISETPVSFGKFARYFRDVLHTPNALFLDGSVSQLWDPGHGRRDDGVPLGPFIVVEQPTGRKP
ncbi:MAG: phosphodiester glycosidase family protein [Porphyrobacter sp.]|nr:phosphodiester glycosidase family protein [Porphyrobacter sp.]